MSNITGCYVALERPLRIVFDFSVPKFTKDSKRVCINIASLPIGCELTLAHDGVWTDYAARTREGWIKILDKLATIL